MTDLQSKVEEKIADGIRADGWNLDRDELIASVGKALDAWPALREALKWQPMETAPKDARILAVVRGQVRMVKWGKTSHVPIYGWCLADQGVEDFDICEPTGWIPLPPAPKEDGR